jgi:hypothetical protein
MVPGSDISIDNIPLFKTGDPSVEERPSETIMGCAVNCPALVCLSTTRPPPEFLRNVENSRLTCTHDQGPVTFVHGAGIQSVLSDPLQASYVFVAGSTDGWCHDGVFD